MKSSRNKTITVTPTEVKNFKDFKIPERKQTPKQLQNKIFLGNALDLFKFIPDESVDLIVTDPPYNIGKEFGKGSVNLSDQDFTDWCSQWIAECHRVLKPNGSIYICIDWPRSAMIQSLLSKDFNVRNRITWKRDKGRGSKSNWKNNMEDVWYATKTADYTFNLDDVKIKREVIAPYVDEKGNAKDWFEEKGKKYRLTHPSNIWTDLVVPFWSMSENTEHPTQKPQKLFERIIRASSNPDDLIFDPFMGSGTTAAAAKRLARKYSGFEIEKKFYVLTHKRIS